MHKPKDILKFDFVVFSVLAIFHVLFFFSYQLALGLSFNWITALFVVSLAVNIVLLLRIFHFLATRIAVIGLYALFLFYTLVNFAYYQVYDKYWRINLAQLKQIHWSTVDLLLDFSHLIPWYVYLTVMTFLCLMLIGVYLYFRQDRNRSINTIELVYGQEHTYETSPVILWKIVVACIIFFVSTNFAVSLLLNVPLFETKDGYSEKHFFSQVGPYGFLLYLALGQQDTLEASAYVPEEPEPEKTDFDYIKLAMDQLRSKQSTAIVTDQLTVEKPASLPHILIYQMESVDAWPLLQEPSPMPFLEELQKNEITVDNFYSNSCTTINAEFSTLCSFFPDSYGPISDLYSNNNYRCLPSILTEQYGYKTYYHHANQMDFWNRDKLGPAWGFEEMVFEPQYRQRESDENVLMSVVAEMQQSSEPTFNYVVGFTSHAPHNQDFIDFNTNERGLTIKPYEGTLSDKFSNIEVDAETVRDYMGFLTGIDQGLETLFDELHRTGLYDNTIVIIFGDHRYYNFKSDEKLEDFYLYNRIPFVMHIPGQYQGSAQNSMSNVDVAPTILHILQGDDKQMPEQFIGTSIFSDQYPNISICKCLGEATFVNPETIIQGSVMFNRFVPITPFFETAEHHLTDYTGPLRSLLALTDRVLERNELGSAQTQTAGEIDLIKAIDLNEVTDSDNDGLSDLREKAIGTNRFNPDTDGDGYLDGEEVINGYNPLGEG